MNFSDLYKRLTPYKAGEQPQDRRYIKLNTNENPYPPSAATTGAVRDTRSLNLYPDPDCTGFRAAAAALHGVLPENVFAGNGSDEVLSFCFGAFFDPKGRGPVLFPDVTYSFYPVYCKFYGIPYRAVPLDTNYEMDLTAYRGAQGVVIANPNAPTGVALKKNKILQFAGENPDTVIVVDEAYADFSDESVVTDSAAYKNLLVVRTLSKGYSLAGLRLGYAVGDAALIAALSCMRDSFNSYTADTLAQAVGTAALNDAAYYRRNAEKVAATRDAAAAALAGLGYKSLPSGANFLFVRCPQGGEATYRYLKDNGILVRYFDGARTRDFVRITVGTDEEMHALAAAIERWK